MMMTQNRRLIINYLHFLNRLFKIMIVLLLLQIGYTASLPNQLPHNDYYTHETGHVYFFVNVLGHVKSPGTYLVNDNADILTVLSQAGGPLQGAKLKHVKLLQKGKPSQENDLIDVMDNGIIKELKLYPNDTIMIDQSFGSYLFSKSNIINSVLQVLNIYLTISRTQ